MDEKHWGTARDKNRSHPLNPDRFEPQRRNRVNHDVTRAAKASSPHEYGTDNRFNDEDDDMGYVYHHIPMSDQTYSDVFEKPMKDSKHDGRKTRVITHHESSQLDDDDDHYFRNHYDAYMHAKSKKNHKEISKKNSDFDRKHRFENHRNHDEMSTFSRRTPHNYETDQEYDASKTHRKSTLGVESQFASTHMDLHTAIQTLDSSLSVFEKKTGMH